MSKETNANLFSALLIGFTIFILLLLPIRIEFVPNQTAAQEATLESVQPSPIQAEEIEFTLRSAMVGEPPMAFVGVGGDIQDVINPVLEVKVGEKVTIHLINGDPITHDLKVDAFNVTTGELYMKDQKASITFTPTAAGDYEYYCSVPGHKEIGMKGIIRVVGEQVVENSAPAAEDAVSIVRSPSDVPEPVGDRAPMTLRVDMETVEVTGQLADGTTFNYFTFDGQVPGPMLRVRVGDTIEFFLKNAESSKFPHSIDLHSVTGPGGGAIYTQTMPGQETSFTFQAINPGLYVYHCATPSIPHHISSGMYGLILVEPVGGLPPVDREFYVMQGDIYTEQPFGTAGHADFSIAHMGDEDADYLVFNGAVGGLNSDENALRANVGETVRIYFGVGGPNYTSSFHVIGEIFDRVYDQASVTSEPLTNVQTTLVPPGGATIVEFKVDVPGRYILVDHALSRLERGLAGYLYVEGAENPAVFHGEGDASMAGH